MVVHLKMQFQMQSLENNKKKYLVKNVTERVTYISTLPTD